MATALLDFLEEDGQMADQSAAERAVKGSVPLARPNLLLLGCRGRPELAAAMLGSVSLAVATGAARCGVMVIRKQVAMKHMQARGGCLAAVARRPRSLMSAAAVQCRRTTTWARSSISPRRGGSPVPLGRGSFSLGAAAPRPLPAARRAPALFADRGRCPLCPRCPCRSRRTACGRTTAAWS